MAGTVSAKHLVQLFDDPESLAETVGRYLFEGWQAGETLLVVARPEHWARASRVLALNGCPVDAAIASGELVVHDAATMLASFLRNGRPVPERFARTLGRIVGDLAKQREAPLRIYGDMVDILAAQAELVGACEVEALWNELGSHHAYTLLCGYSSGHFGDPRTAGMLRTICEAHDHSSAKPTDLLGCWLLADRRSRFHTDGQLGTMPVDHPHEHTPDEERRIRDAALDQTLEGTFPASDPPSTLPNPDDDEALDG